jgi:hypothetical protein
MTLLNYRQIVEEAGAVFVRVDKNSVYFRDREDEVVLSLYSFALTAENVRLALKNHREPTHDFAPLLPTG